MSEHSQLHLLTLLLLVQHINYWSLFPFHWQQKCRQCSSYSKIHTNSPSCESPGDRWADWGRYFLPVLCWADVQRSWFYWRKRNKNYIYNSSNYKFPLYVQRVDVSTHCVNDAHYFKKIWVRIKRLRKIQLGWNNQDSQPLLIFNGKDWQAAALYLVCTCLSWRCAVA